MREEVDRDQQGLRLELGQTRERLAELVAALRSVEADLEEGQKRHDLLHQVCHGLEQLAELGASGAFWDGQATPLQAEEHLRLVRGRAEGLEKRIGEIEERRHSLSDEIDHVQGRADLLEADVFDAWRREEERKLEWVIEREPSGLPASAARMPWSRGGEDDERFRKTLASSLFVALLFALLFPLIDLPLPERWEPLEVPERLTRLIREERPVPPLPPMPQTKPEEKEPEPVEELVAEEPAPKETGKQAPEPNAEPRGILAFREKFSGLAEEEPAARLGAQARIRNEGTAAPGRAGRSMVTTQAAGSSGGINLAALSRDVGGGGDGIQRVEITRVTSSIGAGGGSERPLSDGPGLARTDEEIQIVFDRHKAALYRLYNRELRRDPTLQGQMVLRIRIEPDGSVSLCQLQSSDMDAPGLAAQVVARVHTFDFGAKEKIPPITILYPIDFLPAT